MNKKQMDHIDDLKCTESQPRASKRQKVFWVSTNPRGDWATGLSRAISLWVSREELACPLVCWIIGNRELLSNFWKTDSENEPLRCPINLLHIPLVHMAPWKMEIILEITSCWVWHPFCNSYMCDWWGGSVLGEVPPTPQAERSVVLTRMWKYFILWQSCSRLSKSVTDSLEIFPDFQSRRKGAGGPSALGFYLAPYWEWR